MTTLPQTSSAEAALYARWNATYGEFFVTRWSIISSRQVQVGKSHPTVEAAIAAARDADRRGDGRFMHFIDVVSPSRNARRAA